MSGVPQLDGSTRIVFTPAALWMLGGGLVLLLSTVVGITIWLTRLRADVTHIDARLARIEVHLGVPRVPLVSGAGAGKPTQ